MEPFSFDPWTLAPARASVGHARLVAQSVSSGGQTAELASVSGSACAEAGQEASPRRGWSPLQRLKNNLLYGLAVFTMAVVRRLPVRLALGLGKLVGLLGYLLAGGERRKALRSLAVAFAELIYEQGSAHVRVSRCALADAFDDGGGVGGKIVVE